MDVRHGPLRLSARAGRADDGALDDGGSLGHVDRPEVDQRDGETVRGQDRHRQAVRRHGPCERDRSRRRRANGLGPRAGHVDAAMLAGRVGVARRREGPEDGPLERPRPRSGRRCDRERERHHDARHDHPHRALTSLESMLVLLSVLIRDNVEIRVAGGSAVVQ
jgi:hypothetical protein